MTGAITKLRAVDDGTLSWQTYQNMECNPVELPIPSLIFLVTHKPEISDRVRLTIEGSETKTLSLAGLVQLSELLNRVIRDITPGSQLKHTATLTGPMEKRGG